MDAEKTFPGMRQALVKLHLSVFLAGFTGVLGKLISISEGMLVWYRMLLTFVLLWGYLQLRGQSCRASLRDFSRIAGVGVILCLHWLFFYGSIKASNISIGVVCYALAGFFTAFFEPLIMRRRVAGREIYLSILTLFGVGLVFSLDVRYRVGILAGVVSSVFAALFTVVNKRVCASHPPGVTLLYEMAGGVLFLSCLLPLYIRFFDVVYLFPTPRDWVGLLILSFFCTIMMLILQIDSLRYISAFTVNLSYNLEPVYSIAVAILFLGEGRELGVSFYAGLAVIMLSVALQTWTMLRERAALPAFLRSRRPAAKA